MEYEIIRGITREWEDMTGKVLDLKELSVLNIEELIADTYEVLTEYHKDALIPKEITKLLLEIKDFHEISSAIEFAEKPNGYYHSMDILLITNAIINGFLKGEYECEFPKLQIKDINDNAHVIDLKTNFLPLSSD
ncbi:MAG: hypothetical protein IJ300_00130 [Clostridia bacterium]|nr:hypothetical protein [Clostridia bacterium]